jgi:lipid-A-disaccharide synthase
MEKNILIVAGDLSGDMHAANLVKALKKVEPQAKIYALGGNKLKESADIFLENLVTLGTFGFFQPIKQFFKLLVIFNKLKGTIRTVKFERVILVDYYGFNIHAAAFAKKHGIKTFYFISPQVWATRRSRIKKIGKAIDKMLVILPFEEELYRKENINVEFVGHPLLDIVPEPLPPEPKSVMPVNLKKIVIGLFPGSRPSVFIKHMQILCEAAQIIRSEIGCEFKLFLASEELSKGMDCPFPYTIGGDYSQKRDICFAISTSGTVSLENTLMGIPMIVIYKLSWFNYSIAKALIKIPYITLANILAKKVVVPELIQNDCTPEKIARKAVEMLKDDDYLDYIKGQLASIRKMLGTPGVLDRTARQILEEGTVLSNKS